MSDFSFLAVPNIQGMRLLWYIQLFGVVILFGVCLFFVLYFLLRYRARHRAIHQLDDFDYQAQHLKKQLLHQKIQQSFGKMRLVLFIEYLEKFVTTDTTGACPKQTYATLWELLLSQWFSLKEIEELEQVLYADNILTKDLEEKIMTIISKHYV